MASPREEDDVANIIGRTTTNVEDQHDDFTPRLISEGNCLKAMTHYTETLGGKIWGTHGGWKAAIANLDRYVAAGNR